MKYKLIERYPNSPKVGTIIESCSTTQFDPADYPKNWVPLEKVLTTDDGVDIFPGEDYYLVTRDMQLKLIVANPLRPVNDRDLKSFSTMESAKDYLLMNRKTFSVQDLIDARERFFARCIDLTNSPNADLRILKELAHELQNPGSKQS